MFDKPDRNQLLEMKKVRQAVDSLGGGTQLINDSLYENYLTACLFYDDNFCKTSYFLDCLSTADLRESFVSRTQDYSLLQFQYLPAAMFKLYCAHMRGKQNFLDYPKLSRQMAHDFKASAEIAD